MKKVILTIVMMAFLFTGCKFAQTKEKWCDKIPQDQYSIICILSNKLNVQPEEIASTLKITNIAAIASDVYTAKQAIDFINKIEGKVKQGKELNVTYQTVIEYAIKEYSNLSPEIQALFIIMKDYYQIDIPEVKLTPLSAYDWEGIEYHLGEQKAIIQPFLIAK